MITIVMYTDFIYGKQNPTGGTQRYLELIYGLIDRGILVHLFAPKDAELIINNYLIRHDIKTCSAYSFLIPNVLLNYLVNIKMISSIRNIKYDAIISFDVPSSIQFSTLRLKNLLVFIRQDLIAYRNINIISVRIIKCIYLRIMKIIERYVLLRANKIIVQCKYDKDVLIDRHSKCFFESKILVLNNNVNPSWVANRNYDNYKRHINKNIKLSFVGNFDDKRKGLDILLNAVAILLDKGENITLHVIGGGKLLDHYIKQYINRPNIIFYGKLKDPLLVINECDLLVVPSIADSFPNTIMEALYLELPVIGSNVGGIPEMLKYEDLIFPPNIADLVVKLRDIIHGDKFELYREYSRKRKKELTFDWVERVCELIQCKSSTVQVKKGYPAS